MGSIVKDKGGDFKVLDEGTHLAICNAVVDIGLQNTVWDSQQENVWLRFEVPAERIQYIKDGAEIDEPMSIWTRYNKTLNKKATLRKDLDAWRGRNFSEDELQGFDLFNLVGKPCLITVVHNQSGDRIYANISAIAKVMKDQEISGQELESICFSPNDTDQYENVPEWLQEKFDNRVELEELAEEPAANDDFEDDLDELPF